MAPGLPDPAPHPTVPAGTAETSTSPVAGPADPPRGLSGTNRSGPSLAASSPGRAPAARVEWSGPGAPAPLTVETVPVAPPRPLAGRDLPAEQPRGEWPTGTAPVRRTPLRAGGADDALGHIALPHEDLEDESARAASNGREPPPPPRVLAHGAPFERRVSVDGFLLAPDADPLLPSFLASVVRVPAAAAADARLTGLGWTETLTLERGLGSTRWAVAARWAPPALSARPAALGLGGPVVADGPEGAAVSAPRGAWRAAGLLGGPLARGRLGSVLSLEATGLGLPAPEPGLAAGGRSRQTLTLATTWLPSPDDHLLMLVLAGRRTESPDCFRCTESAARVDRALALFGGLSWTHAFTPGTTLELRLSTEHRGDSAGARAEAAGTSHLDLSSWITDGGPGALGPDLAASALEAARTRVQLGGSMHAALGPQQLEGGLLAMAETRGRALSIPGGVRFLDRGGRCGEGQPSGCAFRLEMSPDQVQARGWSLGAYVQDTLQLGDLTLRGGVRLDLAQAASEDLSTGLRLGLGPRLALAWNVAGEGRQWLLLHAGRSHDSELQSVVTRASQPPQRLVSWIDGAFDGCAQPGPTCVRLGGPATVVPGGLPHADEVALGWRGRLWHGIEGGVEARWRRTAQLWTEEELGLLTDERGRWTSLDGQWQSRRRVAADGRAWRRALRLGVWATARTGPVRLSATWSVTQVSGTATGPFDGWLADTRTAALAEGPLPEDQRHRVWLSLALHLHPAVELGARLRYASGAPLWETFAVPGSAGLRTVLAPRGEGVLRAEVVALRDPDLFAADAWIRFRLGALLPAGTPRLDLILEAAQVAGGNTPVHLSASSSRLGAVLRREPPFQLVVGLRAGD